MIASVMPYIDSANEMLQKRLKISLYNKECMSKVYDDKLYYTKCGVELHEYKMHKYVYNLNIVNIPKVVKYDKKTKVMTMMKVHGISISDIFTEEPDNISTELFERIREIILKLVENNIEYVDITGYNFMLDDMDRLWIIDFEHAKYVDEVTDEFVLEFCDGLNVWNPLFK
jgi:tRNA A-37 threonylcarbamoyl transferase component Bud32